MKKNTTQVIFSPRSDGFARCLIIIFCQLIVGLFPFAPSTSFADNDGESTTLNVLMIGNSYTAGAAPAVESFFVEDPDFELQLTRINPGGAQLLQHARTQSTLDQISDGDWDAVILQDQSQTPGFAYLEYSASGTTLEFADWAQANVDSYSGGINSPFVDVNEQFWAGGSYLAEAVQATGTELLWYSTWARHVDDSQTLQNFPGSTQEQRAASMNDYTRMAYECLESAHPFSRMSRVGDAWKASYQLAPGLRLHSADNSHGSAAGNFLTAAILYQSLTGKSAIENSNTGGLNSQDAIFLKQIAADQLSVLPASYGVVRGVWFSGDANSLAQPDDEDLTLQRDSASLVSVCELEVKGSTQVQMPLTFKFQVESSVFARRQVVQTIYLYNYDDDLFEVSGSGNASRFTDNIVEVFPVGDLSRFVEPGTGCVEARVRYRSLFERQVFSANVDQIVWTITE